MLRPPHRRVILRLLPLLLPVCPLVALAPDRTLALLLVIDLLTSLARPVARDRLTSLPTLLVLMLPAVRLARSVADQGAVCPATIPKAIRLPMPLIRLTLLLQLLSPTLSQALQALLRMPVLRRCK